MISHSSSKARNWRCLRWLTSSGFFAFRPAPGRAPPLFLLSTNFYPSTRQPFQPSRHQLKPRLKGQVHFQNSILFLESYKTPIMLSLSVYVFPTLSYLNMDAKHIMLFCKKRGCPPLPAPVYRLRLRGFQRFFRGFLLLWTDSAIVMRFAATPISSADIVRSSFCLASTLHPLPYDLIILFIWLFINTINQTNDHWCEKATQEYYSLSNFYH